MSKNPRYWRTLIYHDLYCNSLEPSHKFLNANLKSTTCKFEVGQPTSNVVSGHYKQHLFVFVFSFLRRLLFSQKECSDQKTYLAKVAQNAQTPSAILGPPGGYIGFCGRCRRQRVPPSPLGWYYYCFHKLYGSSELVVKIFILQRLA